MNKCFPVSEKHRYLEHHPQKVINDRKRNPKIVCFLTKQNASYIDCF